MSSPRSLTPQPPVRVVNFARIFARPAAPGKTRILTSPPPPRDLRLQKAHKATGPVSLQIWRPGALPAAKLAPLKSGQFAVTWTGGTLSPIAGTSALEPLGTAELDLPFGTPRFVNAATLKRMLKARRSDVLLKRTGDSWEVCENSLRIDLTDDAAEFRLGTVQIYS